MTAREELVQIISHSMNNEFRDPSGRAADAVLTAGYRKPRVVTTVEELAALPVGSVISVATGQSSAFTIVKLTDCEPAGLDYYGPGDPIGHDAYEVPLPATVIWEPQS